MSDDIQRYAFQRTAILRQREEIVTPCKICNCGRILVKTWTESDPVTPRVKDCECWKRFTKVRDLLVSNINPEFWDVKTWKIVNNKEVWSKHIYPYTENLPKARRLGRGFFFYGENGLGKTTAGIYILIAALEDGYKVHYAPLRQLMTFLRKAYLGEKDKEALVDEISRVDFLIIDEMGKVNNTDFVIGEVESILRERVSKLLPTMVISNLGLKAFEDTYGRSTMSLLEGSMLLLEFTGQDFRRTVKRQKIEKYEWE